MFSPRVHFLGGLQLTGALPDATLKMFTIPVDHTSYEDAAETVDNINALIGYLDKNKEVNGN